MSLNAMLTPLPMDNALVLSQKEGLSLLPPVKTTVRQPAGKHQQTLAVIGCRPPLTNPQNQD